MKTERIQIRTTEKTKLKLLQQSQYYHMNLSDFMLTVTKKACDLDVIQIWIHAYVDFTIKRNREDNGCIVTHTKFDDGEEYWNVPPLKNGYWSKSELLKDLNDACGGQLPKKWTIVERWDEFVRRLKLLGMWREENE